MSNILIVDDKEENRYLLHTILTAAGHATREAANGAEALESARREPPDLIISDILMPQMDGFALCRECKRDETLRGIPFVFYTATYTDPRDRDLGLQLGAARFLVKPMEAEEFSAIIAEVLKEHTQEKSSTPPPPAEDETTIYRLYNEALVRKLEDKMLALEETNRALQSEMIERERLTDEKARQMQVLEASLNEIYMFAADSLRFTYVNLGARKNLGYTMDELFQLTPVDLKPEFTLEQFQDMLRPLLSHQEEVRVFETLHRRKDGTLYPVEVHLQLVGALFVAIIHDITERRQAEEEIDREKLFSDTVINSLPGIFYLFDEQGRFWRWNNNFEKVSGYSAAEIAAIHPLDFFEGQDKELIQQRIGQVFANGEADAEAYFVSKDGTRTPHYFTGLRIRINETVYLTGVGLDISERKRAEEEIRLLQTVALGIGEAESLDAAYAFVLQEICQATGWAMGEAWVPSRDGEQMICHPAWHSRIAGLEAFRQASQSRLFAPGEGLPGRVWQTKKPVWIPNVSTTHNFARIRAAAAVGLKAAFGVPVLARGQVVLVMAFFLREARAEDQRMMHLVSALAAQIGALVERRQAEASVQQFTRLYATLSQVNQSIVRAKDRAELFQSICRVAVEFGKFRLAWIGLFDRETGEVALTAAHGLAEERLSRQPIDLNAPPFRDGLMGRAVRADGIVYSRDLQTDLTVQHLRELATAGGFYAAAIPFHLRGEIAGLLNLYATDFDFFADADQHSLLAEMAWDIGYALDAMELERRRAWAEAQIVANERRFRALIEKSADVIVLLDAGGTLLYRSPSAQGVFGRSDEESLGRNFAEFIHPEDLPRIRELFAGLLRTPGKSFDAEFRYRHRDGDWRYVKATATNWLDDPDVGAIVGNVRDVTERVQAEEQVNFQAHLLGLVGNAVIATDLQGKVTYWNFAAQKLYGWSAAEALGRPIAELTPTEQSREQVRGIMDQLAQGKPWSGEFLVRRKDGHEFPAFVFDTPIVDADGNLTGVIGVSNDISERKRAEERIRRQIDELQAVHRIGQRFARLQSLEELAEEIIATLEQNLNYSLCAIMLLDETGQTLYPYAVSDQNQGKAFAEADKAFIASHGLSIGKGLVGWVAQHGQSVRTGDAQNDPRYYAVRSNIQSELCVPLWLGDRVIGVINVEDTRPDLYTESDERVLGTVAAHIAVAIQNARLLQQLQQELAARREAEEHYRLLVENIPAVVYRDGADDDATSSYLNPQVEALLGYAPAAYQEDATLWHRQIDPRDYEIAAGSIRETLAQGKAEAEYRMLARDGRRVWVHDSSVLVRDAAGAPQFILGFMDDISERKQREQELEAVAKIAASLRTAETMEELLSSLLDETLALFGTDSGSIRLYHPGAGVLYNALARGWFEPLRAAAIQPGEGIVGAVFSSGQAHISREFTSDPLALPDAKTRITPGWGGICVPLSAATQVVGAMFVGVPLPREITPAEAKLLRSLAEIAGSALHRLRLYEETQLQAEQMGQVMRSVQDGVLLLDDESRLLKTNPAGLEYLALLAGFTSAGAPEAEGGGEGARLTRLGDRALADLLTSPSGAGWHEIRCNGRVFEALAHPLAPGPTDRGWVLVVRDVTRQREVQEQLQRQERLAAVGQLAAGIAHDFNNLMGAILLHAQLLDYSTGLKPRERERLSVIQQQARHASAMIGQILDFSRRAMLERQPLDLLPLFKEQVKLLQRTLPEHIRIDLIDEGGEYVVLADPTRMQQVLMNLAINARDAMPEGGNLTIDLAHLRLERASELPLADMTPGDWVRVVVSDTGSGITPEILPHIFEPFFTTKGPGKGTGLGLAQVYGIVGQHGGQITAHSQVGQGTVFTLYLPALMDEAGDLPAPEDELLLGKGELLLLVEDNEPLRDALAEYLQTCNYRVVSAGNGEEALALLAAADEQPALVLSDLVMPRMGGKALLAALRGQGYRMPVVLITGHPLDESELHPLTSQGMGAWLRKPFQMGDMARAIARCLAAG